MTSDDHSERREAPRRALRRPAWFLLPGVRRLEVRTLDISAGGLAVVAPANPPVGMACTIRLTIPTRNSSAEVIEPRVKVMQSLWSTADEGFKVGLRFQDLSSAHARLIRDYMDN